MRKIGYPFRRASRSNFSVILSQDQINDETQKGNSCRAFDQILTYIFVLFAKLR